MDIFLDAIGCRLNEAELESWAGDFRKHGHRIVNDAGDAQLMIFNTCAVTQEAVRKSRQSIKKLHRGNPTARLVVSGCYVSLDNEEEAAGLGVDLVVRNSDKDKLVKIAHEVLDLPVMPQIATEPAGSALFARNRQRAFIKIQDGCRYRCTFCIVTTARGEERSRPVAEIIDEINQQHAAGIQEVVLTGVHVGGYGSDNDSSLFALVKAILADTDVPRVRFASVEPWDLPDGFFDLFSNPRLMPHMHLPVQSGSDPVLRKMARRCKTAEYRALLADIRSAVPGFEVSTDIIVGFPGETEEDWQNTCAFTEEMGFSHVHIFSYSPRSGTKAAGLPGQLPGDIKKQRSRELHAIAAQSRREALARNRKREHRVLWEAGRIDPVKRVLNFSGYTENYLRVHTQTELSMDLESRVTGFQPRALSEDGSALLGEVIAD
ncbi:tRNA (N(6)-L-threonylcarbamoyladenosine(37)-C(2))-methylthiotransferase MtaB [Granulosicoccaceae sp. 1_MG-2023]|nr:tRNA (N(6)-L-threonylcarbamoyladenosine(37)-C(2))-methylthiotransferase MtaB [Granulosicoccaceae sp. 1_MG-2023]